MKIIKVKIIKLQLTTMKINKIKKILEIINSQNSIILIINIYINIVRSNLIKFYNKNFNEKYCSILPLLFNFIGKEISAEAEPIIQYSFNMFILSIIAFTCFINLIGYFTSIYLINKYRSNLESQYPKLKKWIDYYEKSNIYFIISEIILCTISLISLILINLMVLGIFTFSI
jgi:hypothetical protein